MRIEAYTQVQQLYQSQKLSRTQKTKTATHTDRLQISRLRMQMQDRPQTSRPRIQMQQISRQPSSHRHRLSIR